MKDAEPPIRFREWGRKSYGELDVDVVRRLEEASSRLVAKSGNGEKPHVFDFYRNEFRARSYVGVVAAGGTVVEILPKIHGGEEESLGYLLALLRYTGALGTKRGDVAGLGEHRGTFLEAWILHFATELNRLLIRSFKQKYVEIEERSAFLRGRLLTERDMDGSSKISTRYPCRYEIFTPNHLLNRTLKFCNRLLMKQSRSSKNRTLLQQNDFLLDEVDDAPVLVRDLDRIHLDRLSREYEPILEMCRLLLENSALDLRAGRITQLAIVFDMNALFERFVVEFLRRRRGRLRLWGEVLREVESKDSIGNLFGHLRMEPDIILSDTAGRKFIVDTKYKILPPGGRPSREDLYQIHAYATAGKRKYDGVVLLYPVPTRVDFEHGDVRLYVRGFDPSEIYDVASRRLNEKEIETQLEETFSDSGEIEERASA